MKVNAYHVYEGSTRILDRASKKEISNHFGLSESYITTYIKKGLKLKRRFSIVPVGQKEVKKEMKTQLSDIQKEIINELCNCNMNKCEVARKIFVNLNTVTYHIEQIKLKTGLNPNNFYDLIKLREIACQNLAPKAFA